MRQQIVDKEKPKKLLLLGGKNLGSSEIVKYAKSIGIYTIVTDYLNLSQSPAKVIADECWDISTSDVELLKKKIKEENVSSIFAGIHEFNISKCIELCEQLNLPCYCNNEQWSICSDKRKFKKLCKKFDVPTPKQYEISSTNYEEVLAHIQYPVIVKPIKGESGIGIVICNNEKELKIVVTRENVDKYVVEKYYKTGEEATIFYILQDGKIMLSAMGDRIIKYSQPGIIPLPVGYRFPSKYIDKYISELNQHVVSMFTSIGLKNGMLFIQAIIEDGKCIPYEMGYRLTGSSEYCLLDNICGFNPLSMMTNYSLFGKMANEDISKKVNPYFNDKYACNITYLVKIGTIAKIEGIDKIKQLPSVINTILSYQEGDIIPPSSLGTLRQVIFRVFAVENTISDLKNSVQKINSIFNVYDDKGESMLLPCLNPYEDF